MVDVYAARVYAFPDPSLRRPKTSLGLFRVTVPEIRNDSFANRGAGNVL